MPTMPAPPPAHAGHVIEALRRERTGASRFNGWLADHLVGLAGTMAFFYLLCAILGGWTLWQAGVEANKGFDPFPFAFLFFVLGGIMQSLFVPTMLVAANRATERQRIKDEIDHRDATHMYEVNDEQLRLLRLLIDRATATT
jgi:uncharacterized membrane protein